MKFNLCSIAFSIFALMGVNVNGFQMSPSKPVTKTFNFNGDIKTEVYDIIGNRLKVINETNISLRDYSKGIYIIKITYGDRVQELKVIKE